MFQFFYDRHTLFIADQLFLMEIDVHNTFILDRRLLCRNCRLNHAAAFCKETDS